MKRKFVVTVNGKSYQVEVEEAKETEEEIPPEKETPPQLSEAAPSDKKEEIISAPFPGKVLSIKVDQGDSVNQGQSLIIIEAMKMETEISAPRKGAVKKILVKEGDMVKTDSKLLVIK